MTSSRQKVKRKFAIFEVFRAYIREFSIFFHEIHIVGRSYLILAADIKQKFACKCSSKSENETQSQ